MTPNEMDVAIAEHLGWRCKFTDCTVSPVTEYAFGGMYVQSGGSYGWSENGRFSSRTGKALSQAAFAMELCHIPNYSGDLNAMHEAEESLTAKERAAYAEQLTHAIRDQERVGFYHERFVCIHLEASQRAEAFLRTVGKHAEAELATNLQ